MRINVARSPRQRGGDLPKYYAIKAVAEAVDVSSRTVRRWIRTATWLCIALMVSFGSLRAIYGRFWLYVVKNNCPCICVKHCHAVSMTYGISGILRSRKLGFTRC